MSVANAANVTSAARSSVNANECGERRAIPS
jgi:hypothetical protein